MPWCVTLLLVFAVACDRQQPTDVNRRPRATVDRVTLKDVQSIHVNDSDLSIQYATRTPIRDRQGQIEEIPLVWDLLVKDRLKGAVFSEVTLFPEDLSGSSFSITFTKNTSGQWNALAPYRIRIPVDGEPASR